MDVLWVGQKVGAKVAVLVVGMECGKVEYSAYSRVETLAGTMEAKTAG